MHYCGGELETVSFVVKSNSCCGEEEEDMDECCCANENTFARYAPDFTAQKINTGSDLQLPSVDLFFLVLFHVDFSASHFQTIIADYKSPPPKLLQSDIVKTSVLRI